MRGNSIHNSVSTAPPECAEAAGLRYAGDRSSGIRRIRSGSGFRYVGPNGRAIRDATTLKRIRSLVIPPAWTDVWITTDPNAHLQATGRDARRRKQYRYHAKWREIRHQTKYDRLIPFALALPHLRQHVARDLRESSLCRPKVVATVVQLLEKTLIRIGNTEYARSNRSYGLTTLRDRHVRIRGARVRFEFVGKSGIKQSITLNDSQLARVVKRCQELPGQELFQYEDEEGQRRVVTSADVNAYVRQATGGDFTAKDFRTWAGTLLAASALASVELPDNARKTKTTIVRAVESVARHLGNTPSVCRACYIHPAVLEAYADGTLRTRLVARRRRGTRGLTAPECAVLNLLQSRRSLPEQLAASVRLARARRRRSDKIPRRQRPSASRLN